MNAHRAKRINLKKTSLAASFLALVAGCSDRGVRVYEVPKEPRFEMAATHQHQSLPHLHWEELPPGWEELPPAGMRVANFQVLGPEGKMAEVGVFALPGVQDIELESVNLWRGELGLEPLTEENLDDAAATVQAGGRQGRLYDLSSASVQPGKTFKQRTLGIVLPREEALWFIKMSGEEELVGGQKEEFVAFVKELEFHGADAHGPAPSPQTPVISSNTERVPPTADLPQWTVPEAWQARPPGSMLLASFIASGDQGQAEITISKLPADGGGLLANVNRWRGQLGLGPVTEAQLSGLVSQIEVDAENAPLVDLKGTNARTGQPARMLAVAVPQHGETWFYKMMGEESVVEKERQTFISFVQSAY